MKVIRKGEGSKQDNTANPMVMGGKVVRENLVADSPHINFGVVSFAKGARNKFHTHTSDQILFVTSGVGIVATEKEQVTVRTGDTVWVPAGERHWHGATPDSEFAHAVIVTPDSKTQAV
ncbi:MAG: cupin domain-containing protein [SAR202 cluster bacterium]|nr:cupin domain-containing protein [SAR202 cluster bacterium]